MKYFIAVLSAFMLALQVKAQTPGQTALPAAFQKKLDDGKLTFTKPQGAVEVPLVANNGLAYQYALKFTDKNVEVRYFIMPLGKDLFDAYEQREKVPGDTILYPNKMFLRVPVIIYNKIAEGKLNINQIKLQPMTPREQGAEHGFMFAGPVGPTFGQQYTFGFYAMMHKDFAADVYVLYLFKDEATMQSQIVDVLKNADIIGSVKFKP